MKEQLEKQRLDLEERIRRLDSRPGTPSRQGGSWKKGNIFNKWYDYNSLLQKVNCQDWSKVLFTINKYISISNDHG